MAIMIGSDPEFNLKKGNSNISASSVIQGRTGVEWGTDGNSSTGEIRPKAENTPEAHFNNIKTILKNNLGKMSDVYKVDVTSTYNNCGGHIHISGVSEDKIQKLVKNLDNFLGLPFMLIEPKDVFKRHIDGSYGLLGDYRTESCANGTKVEYRTLPTWLATPQLTKMTLAIAYMIADETDNHALDSKLLPSIFQSKIILKDIGDKNNEWFNFGNIVTNAEKLKTFSLYPKYKEEVDKFCEMVAKQERFSTDFEKNWKIKMIETLHLNEEYFKTVMATKPRILKTDRFSGGTTVEPSDDINVAMLANWLNNRLDTTSEEKQRYVLVGLSEARGLKWFASNYEALVRLSKLGLPVRITPIGSNITSIADVLNFKNKAYNVRGNGDVIKIWIPFEDRKEES
jgi:hypothetical protein